MLRSAANIDEAMGQATKLLRRQGCTKIDIKAWPVNQWKEKTNA